MEISIPHENTQALVQGSSLDSSLEERSRFNTLAPIFKLPDELLLKIFMLMKERKRNPQDFKDFHQITRICRHWRDVAIEAPLLWTCLYTDRHNYSLMMLDRSGSAPLDVHVQAPPFNVNVAVAPFMKHIERIQRLTCRAPSDILKNAEAFLASCGRKALTLEELRIDAWNYGNNDWYTFSPPFFSAIHPTEFLHTLELSGVLLDWRVFPVPRLTCLFLNNFRTTTAVSGDAFISALEGMPYLEQLSINIDRLRLHQYPPLSHANPVHLHCLRRLDIQALHLTSHAIYFLTHTALPAIQQLNVHYGRGSTNFGPDLYSLYAPLVRAARSLIANGNFGTIQKLVLAWNRIAVFTASNRDEACVELKIPVDSICKDNRGFSQLASDVLSYFTPTDCPSLVELTLGSISVTKDELLHFFGHRAHLKVVKLFSQLAVAFIGALCVLDEHSPGMPIPFPNLECIHLIEVAHRTPFDDLVHCLVGRRKYGAAIKKLTIGSYFNSPDDDVVKRLRDVVADVEVKTLRL